MSSGDLRPLLVTHSGKFHCDEVFAYAVLKLALGLKAAGEDHRLLRTRDAKLIETGDIVWDVGTVFDPALSRFDHHQRGAPTRPDGTPYSAAGLIWQVYGAQAISALLGPDAVAGMAAAIAGELDESVLRRIDELDNGVSLRGPLQDDGLGLGRLIGDFNPTWDNPTARGPQSGDAEFLEAADFASGVLRRRVDALRARHFADGLVLAAHAAGEDPRILVLAQGMPWKNTVFSRNLPVIYCVSQASNGNWMIDTMPPEKDSFAQRVPLPAAWAGLERDALAATSGVPDAVFVHVRRFVGAAKSRDGALAMAQRALEIGEAEAEATDKAPDAG
ncbi:MYG1 family protein [Acidisoma cellulosilytica]|uniref:MYG1 family protein n=1 Tax=Acidisoma cellulosilyticum TaxID=2802395 RepID=A0A963Z0X0_9PROT|nr:MYG1 family protein [Acidisoma cellulosilyticum]MCB8879972.1 MYG1 family protein [Acidisoma cellulosilyticum]